jgi:lactoylglutathione lyase
MEVVHTAVWVSDIDTTSEFYEDVLGLAYQREFTLDGVLNYYVGTEDAAAFQFKYDPDSDEAVEPSGIDHLAVAVDDVDATFERVVDEADPVVVTAPTDVDVADRRVAFVEDPDGYHVEFVQEI